MNRKLLTLCLALLALHALAQTADDAPWCPPGARWVYRKNSLTSTSFYRYDNAGDTIIQGHPSKMITCTVIFYYGPPGSQPAVSEGRKEYYYAANDSLFWWNDGQFQFLYHFAAQVGERWVERNSRFAPCAAAGFPQQDTLKVRSISTVALGGRTYQRYDVASDSQYYYTGPVLRNIGSLVAPFPLQNEGKCFQMQFPNGAFDPFTFDALVCYSDNVRGSVPVFNLVGYSCADFAVWTTAVSSLASAKGIVLQPNPTRGRVTVAGAGNFQSYRVLSLAGQSLAAGELLNNTLDVAALPQGYYLLELRDKRGQRVLLRLLRQ